VREWERCRPLPAIWPTGPRTAADERQPSRFKAPYSKTIELLNRELWLLDAEVDLKQAYRLAARHLHPDTGGDPAQWAKLDRARQAVGL
jgi:hypothetical protein